MFSFFVHIVLKTTLVLSVIYGIPKWSMAQEQHTQAQQWKSEIDRLEDNYVSIQQEIQHLLKEQRSAEQAYRKKVEKIEALKRGQGHLIDQMDLKKLLGEARDQAQSLKALNEKLRKFQIQSREIQTALLKHLDREIRALEQRAMSMRDPSKQLQALEQLEKLQKKRSDWRQKAVEKTREQSEPNFLDIDFKDPEDIRAALAELQDRKEQLTREIEKIDEQIRNASEMEKIYRYAEDRQDETRILGEDQKPVRMAIQMKRESAKPGLRTDEQSPASEEVAAADAADAPAVGDTEGVGGSESDGNFGMDTNGVPGEEVSEPTIEMDSGPIPAPTLETVQIDRPEADAIYEVEEGDRVQIGELEALEQRRKALRAKLRELNLQEGELYRQLEDLE